ncbi:unnamed protein product [Nesidiocoris tenuis]|uniref:Uncharacterized protein n=1 Tax=Nesidiocoris tenuis TaxID=355587 RepID=A0A6H5GHS3_9HEMI|nr:unnamed protein product [Nesidiocoris tenuis]
MVTSLKFFKVRRERDAASLKHSTLNILGFSRRWAGPALRSSGSRAECRSTEPPSGEEGTLRLGRLHGCNGRRYIHRLCN